MSVSTSLVVIKKEIKNLNIPLPKLAASLNHRSSVSILNAANAGFIDNNGIIWIKSETAHTLIRTNTKNNAKYLLETIEDNFKCTINNTDYVRWVKLAYIIMKRKEENPSNKYLPLVLDILKEIEETSDVKLARTEAEIVRKNTIKTLKSTRIKMFKIKKDELTNEHLNKRTAQFSHIRSVAMFPEVSTYLWNGLIINKSTHDIITSLCVNDEEELFSLCITNSWNINWYKEFKKNLTL